ncbi:MAG TPA: hypothetical protein VMM76_05405, partial [Pirellulaceae bacterium]|nr:hypothetical protein [Pirellulaceae bacterium]
MTSQPKRPKRFRPRFSLRTFLLVITALAVWLGLIVSRAQKQKIAVDVVTKLGGSVYYDYQFLKEGTTLNLPGGTSKLQNGTIITWGASTIVVGDYRHSYLLSRFAAASSPVPKWLSRLVGDEMFVKVIAVHLEDSG